MKKEFATPQEQLKWEDNLLKLPEFMHGYPDDAIQFNENMTRYFNECVDILGYDDEEKRRFLNIEVKTPSFEGGDGKIYPSNDRITYLYAHDKLIALAVETRTLLNFVDFVMVCTITNGSLKFIGELHDVETRG